MTNYVVTSTGGGIAVDGQITLREALAAATSGTAVGDAAAGTGNDTITFAAALSGSTIDIFATSSVTTGTLAINGDSDGDGTRDITINYAAPPFSDQATQEQHFNVSAGATLSLTDITISGGSVFFAPAGSPNPGSGRGGAVENAGTLSLDGAAFTGNSATEGGAIYNAGTVTLNDSSLNGNSAVSGGAIYNAVGGTITGSNNFLSANTATASSAGEGGGAVFNSGGSVTFTDSSIINNDVLGTGGSGGGILTNGGSLTLNGGEVANNNRSDDAAANNTGTTGGGIAALGSATVELNDVRVAGNFAGDGPANGGGLYLAGTSTATITDGNFNGNFADAIFDLDGDGNGGGIWIGAQASASVTNTTFVFNTGAEGAGIFVENGGDLTATGTVFPTPSNASGPQITSAVGSGTAPSAGSGNVEFLAPATLGARPVFGSSQNDVFEGDVEDNTFVGGAGDDVFRGEGGADTMTGGTGNDVYAVDDAGDVVVEAAGEGADAVYASTTFTLPVNVEALILTVEGTGTRNGLGNYLIGLEDDNTLNGEGGNDVLIGNGGEDTLNGGAGQDILDGGAGADIMAGGADNDIYLVTEAGDVVIELADEGNDAVYSQIDGYTMTAGVETLIMQSGISARGSAEANSIYGNDEDNRIDGGAGLDILYGFGGEDTFIFMAADQGPLIEQEIIVNFEGAGVAGGDRLEFDGFEEGSTLVQVSSLSYQVRDAENAVTAQFWLYEGQGVLNADDYAFV